MSISSTWPAPIRCQCVDPKCAGVNAHKAPFGLQCHNDATRLVAVGVSADEEALIMRAGGEVLYKVLMCEVCAQNAERGE